MSNKINLRAAILMLSILAVYMFLVQPCKSDVGTGVLYVYTDTWGGIEAPKDEKGTYYVEIGKTYYIRISGITEFNTGDFVTVKISWTDANTGNGETSFIYNVEVKESDGIKYVDVDWTVPTNAKICETSTVHYRGNSGPEYVASGQISQVGHMHVIPTTFLGSIGALSAIFASLGLHKILKKKKRQ
jgi:hypothetical protein